MESSQASPHSPAGFKQSCSDSVIYPGHKYWDSAIISQYNYTYKQAAYSSKGFYQTN